MKQEAIGVKGTGEKVEAELLYLGKEEITAIDLTSKITDKVIVARKFDRAALMKALTLGAGGVVASEISDELFEEFEHGKDWEIGESIKLKLPLLVVENASLESLKYLNGKKVILDPTEKKITISA